MESHNVKVRPPGIRPLESFLGFQIDGLEAHIQLEKMTEQLKHEDGSFDDMDEVKKFEEWMRKIGNIYRTDQERMLLAYEKITPLKYTDI